MRALSAGQHLQGYLQPSQGNLCRCVSLIQASFFCLIRI
jgi:hypothetical protein